MRYPQEEWGREQPPPPFPGPPPSGATVHVDGPLWRPEPHPAEPADPWPAGPPVPPGDGFPPPEPGPYRRGPRGHVRRVRRRRPVRRALVVLLVLLLALPAGTVAWAVSQLRTEVDLAGSGPAAGGSPPPPGKGTNYLIVGSDSRDGLTGRDREDLHTGTAGGRRTDSMILLHTGAHGTTMVSLPRDSWVTIPAHVRPSTGKHAKPQRDKLNAAFARGGPQMLVRTVEKNTGLRIDHYAEIGFAGFVNIVDAVGGVPMCLEKAVRDEKSGADLREGCQTLNGAQALAFVRQRHQEKDGDLGRTRNQQRFLSALAQKAAAPGTALTPSSLYPALDAGLETLVVDREMDLPELTRMLRAVQGVTDGRGKQLNVPLSGIGVPTRKGSAAKWDPDLTRRLFTELRHDRPVTQQR